MKKDVKCIADEIHSSTETAEWLIMQAYWLAKHSTYDFDNTLDSLFICQYCKDSLNRSSMSSRCVLNGLEVDPLPDSMKELNLFESMLLQKCKSFQTIVRLGPVKKSPSAFRNAQVAQRKSRILATTTRTSLSNNTKWTRTQSSTAYHNQWRSNQKQCRLAGYCKSSQGEGHNRWINSNQPTLTRTSIFLPKQLNEYILGSSTQNDVESPRKLHPTADALSWNTFLGRKFKICFSTILIHPIFVDQPRHQLETYKIKQCIGQPLSIWDTQLDLMCFSDLFPRGRYGKYEPSRQIKIGDAEYRASRLLHVDGRFRRNQQYLFHLLYDSDIKNLSNSISHMLRQTKHHASTVGDIISKIESGNRQLEANLSSLFGNMRGTRQYWYSRQTEVKCMMPEYGPPTWFITLSCAEYTWDNLHEHLKFMNHDVKGVDKMTPGELSAPPTPVLVCRHYHNRIHAILRHLILTKDNPVLGEVQHYFWRVEYQQRGSYYSE